MKCVMLAVFCALLLGCGQRGAGWPGDSALPAAVSRSSSGNYIQHVVIMIQENRSYDNLFATFPGGDGARDGKTHDGKTIRLKQGGLEFDSLGHQHFAFEKEYDHGRMDGFDLVMRAVERGAKIPAGKYAYRYVNPELIEPYWAMARQYVLADHMFATQRQRKLHGASRLHRGRCQRRSPADESGRISRAVSRGVATRRGAPRRR